MRELFALLLFLIGLGLGIAAAAYYYGDINVSLTQSLAEVQSELDEAKDSWTTERATLMKQLATAVEAQQTLDRELEVAQAELAKQAATIARQAELLAALGEPSQVKESDDAQIDRPAIMPDGLINGGQFMYRNVRWARHGEDFEVAGELENRTSKTFTNAFFNIELFSKESRSLGTVTVMIHNFAPGKVMPFSQLAPSAEPDLYDSVRRFRITSTLLQE